MTGNLKKRLIRRVLRHVLSRQCENEIPRTGHKAKDVNCFVVRVDKKGKPDVLLDAINGDTIKARSWDGGRFSIETMENVDKFVDAEIEIVHFYGLNTIRFNGLWDFLWHHWTRFIYLKINLQRLWEVVAQFLFNRRNLTSQRRVNVLRLLVENRLSGNIEGLTYFDVMTKIYSERWINHPAHDSRSSEIEFHLESLCESGDALKERGKITYVARPKSLMTLEQLDEQDRRHGELWRLQFVLVFLTAVMAVAAIVQIYIGK